MITVLLKLGGCFMIFLLAAATGLVFKSGLDLVFESTLSIPMKIWILISDIAYLVLMAHYMSVMSIDLLKM